MYCSDSFRYHGHRFADLQVPYSRRPHTAQSRQFGSNRVRVGAHPAVWNYGAAAAEKRRLSTSERDLMSTTRPRTDHSKEVYANLNGTRAPDIEVKALAAISRDPLHALRSWNVTSNGNDSNVCGSWAGVTCSPQYPHHIVALSFRELKLAGSLSTVMLELTRLPLLRRLDLSKNVFTSSIKGESRTNFSRLSYFNVSGNFLTGEISSEIGKLINLQDLDVSFNNLTGLIPSLANCSFLRFIDLGQNYFKGDVPRWLGALSSLDHLDLSINSLSGHLPGELGNCSSLRYLDVSDNYLLGSLLPEELSKLQLQILVTTRCSFGGSLPLWIGNLTTMQYFSLSTITSMVKYQTR